MNTRDEILEEDSDDFAKDVAEREVSNMIRLTCIVYKRVECAGCMNRKIGERAGGWLQKYGEANEEQPFDQFLRDFIVWAKDETEKEMQEPCTMDTELPDMIIGVPM